MNDPVWTWTGGLLAAFSIYFGWNRSSILIWFGLCTLTTASGLIVHIMRRRRQSRNALLA
ncbi:MAG: hypothetical protein AAF206_29545 [Bacteroidota bacterium]